MSVRKWSAAIVIASGAPWAWAAQPGDPAPDLLVRNCSGVELRLSSSHSDKLAVVLALSPALTSQALDDACRRLESLNAVLLLAPGGSPTATILIDAGQIIRRILPGRTLTGPDLAAFVRTWRAGKEVFETSCARCHGEDGDLHICEDVKPLVGIGKRLTEAQIRERLRMGEINDRDVLIRGRIYSRRDVDAVITYVSGF